MNKRTTRGEITGHRIIAGCSRVHNLKKKKKFFDKDYKLMIFITQTIYKWKVED